MIPFIIIILILLLFILLSNEKPKNENNTITTTNIDYSKYTTKNYIMTPTELTFYRELKKITDKLELSIFPQVDLERIIQVKDNNSKDRNRIKSRSIDYTIVNNKNCKVVCCIELDDKTHNLQNVIKADEFKNNLFQQVNIPLYRIKVQNYYNLDELENKIQSNIHIPSSPSL